VARVQTRNGRELDEVSADHPSGRLASAPQQRERLAIGQPARGWRAGRRHDRGIQNVDIEGDVDRAPPERGDDLLDVPTCLVLGPMDRNSVALGRVELYLLRRRRADAD